MKKYITLFIAALICASSAIAENIDLKTAKEYYIKADSCLQQNNYEEAKKFIGLAESRYGLYGIKDLDFEQNLSSFKDKLNSMQHEPIIHYTINGVSFSMFLVNVEEMAGKRYYLAETPITQQTWETVTGQSFDNYISETVKIDTNQHNLDFGKEKPVYYVSAEIAKEFINSLNKKLKEQLGERKLRLPSKDEIINAFNGENNHQSNIANEWVNNNGTINYININSKNTQTHNGQRRTVGFRVAMDVE